MFEYAQLVFDSREKQLDERARDLELQEKLLKEKLKKMEELNKRTEPTIVVTIAGMSNGLSGVTAGTCVHPVIACPPFKDLDDYNVNIHSTLQMPSDVPVLTVVNQKNCALSCLRILAMQDKALRDKLMERIKKVKAGY